MGKLLHTRPGRSGLRGCGYVRGSAAATVVLPEAQGEIREIRAIFQPTAVGGSLVVSRIPPSCHLANPRIVNPERQDHHCGSGPSSHEDRSSVASGDCVCHRLKSMPCVRYRRSSPRRRGGSPSNWSVALGAEELTIHAKLVSNDGNTAVCIVETVSGPVGPGAARQVGYFRSKATSVLCQALIAAIPLHDVYRTWAGVRSSSARLLRSATPALTWTPECSRASAQQQICVRRSDGVTGQVVMATWGGRIRGPGSMAP